jgi:hypothetical protein
MRSLFNSSNIRRLLLIFLLYLSTALFVSYPLLNHFSTHVPIGSESSGTVPYLNLWILKWNLAQFSDLFSNYWNAPILYPSTGVFAFSEPQPLAGIILIPFRSLNPAALYNSLMVIYTVANAASAYMLLRYTKVSISLALLGGLWVQLLPFLTHERGVIQLQPVFPLLLTLLASFYLFKNPDWKKAILLALSIAATFYLSENYGLIIAIALVPFALYSIRYSRRLTALFILAGLSAIMLTLPLIIPQLNILEEHNFVRSEKSIEVGSASVLDYLTPSKTIVSSSLSHFETTKFGLYPGIGIMLLGILGAFRSHKNEKLADVASPLALSLLLCFLLSFGLNLNIFDLRPYDLIVERVPGFSHLRSPFRFGIWVQLSLVIYAVHFLNDLRLEKYYRPLLLVAFFINFELLPLPARLTEVPSSFVLEGIQSPAVFLPYVQGTSATAYTQTTRYMLTAQDSEITIVNGYSGYLPAANAELKRLLANFPDSASLGEMEEIGVRTILIVEDWLTVDQQAEIDRFIDHGQIREQSAQAGFLVYEIVRIQP